MSIEFTKTNVLGTHVLLECARVSPIFKRFIHISTDEVYGETAYREGVIENSILEPTNPYAASKAAAEQLVRAYCKSFKFPAILTRGNNVYGPRQYPEKVIPKFICRLQRNQPLPIHGDGSALRSFMYITDMIEAFDVILHNGIAGEIYNIGTDFELSVLDTAKKLIQLFNLSDKEDELILHVENRPLNDLRYAIDSSKLHDLGWFPTIDFEEGIRRTVEWYNQNKDLSTIWDTVEEALQPHPQFASVHTI